MQLLIGGAGTESRAISAGVHAALPTLAVMSVPSESVKLDDACQARL